VNGFATVLFVLCIKSSITAELGRAPAVVKVTLQVNGRTEFSGSRPTKTTAGIKMKYGIIDYVGSRTPHAKVGSSRITGGVSPIWVTCTSLAFSQLLILRNRFLDKPTGETAEPIFTRYMSKCVVLRELHSFGG